MSAPAGRKHGGLSVEVCQHVWLSLHTGKKSEQCAVGGQLSVPPWTLHTLALCSRLRATSLAKAAFQAGVCCRGGKKERLGSAIAFRQAQDSQIGIDLVSRTKRNCCQVRKLQQKSYLDDGHASINKECIDGRGGGAAVHAEGLHAGHLDRRPNSGLHHHVVFCAG